MRVSQVIKEAEETKNELSKKRGTLTEADAAPYFTRVGELFASAALHSRGRKEGRGAIRSLQGALNFLNYAVKPEEIALKKFLGGVHGINDVTGSLASRNWGMARIRETMRYNSVHWKGVGDLIKKRGAPESERIEVTPRFLAELTRTLCSYSFYRDRVRLRKAGGGYRLVLGEGKHFIDLDIKGSARLTPGELFTLCRSISNSLHSVLFNKAFYEYKRALEHPEKLKKTLEYLSSKRAVNPAARRSLWPGANESDYRALVKALLGDRKRKDPNTLGAFGLIHPTAKEKVWKDIREKKFGNFSNNHFLLLSKASGSPMELRHLASRLFHFGAGDKIGRLFEKANENNFLKITLSGREARIRDKGLGVAYAGIARYRMGGGTSDFLQERAAEITRGLSEEHGALTRLRFR